MFAPSYFAPTYFAPTFWPQGGVANPGVRVRYFSPAHFAPTYFAPTYWPGTGAGTATDSPADPIEALCAWWAAHASLPDLAGDLWHGMAPRRTPMPFAVITEVADVAVDTYSGLPDYHNTTLQIAVFAGGYREAKALGLAVEEAIEAGTFTIQGRPVCGTFADTRSLEMLPDVGPGGSDTHRQIVEVTMTWVP